MFSNILVSLIAFGLSVAQAEETNGLEALKVSGELRTAVDSSHCAEAEVALKTSEGVSLCFGRPEIPNDVLSEVIDMEDSQYLNGFGDYDYRVTKVDRLSGIIAPADLVVDLSFVQELAYVFNVPATAVNVDTMDIFAAKTGGGFWNLPMVLSQSGILEDSQNTQTGRWLQDSLGDWQGKHLVLHHVEVLDQWTKVHFEYHFFMDKDQLLFFKSVWFES